MTVKLCLVFLHTAHHSNTFQTQSPHLKTNQQRPALQLKPLSYKSSKHSSKIVVLHKQKGDQTEDSCHILSDFPYNLQKVAKKWCLLVQQPSISSHVFSSLDEKLDAYKSSRADPSLNKSSSLTAVHPLIYFINQRPLLGAFPLPAQQPSDWTQFIQPFMAKIHLPRNRSRTDSQAFLAFGSLVTC